ncbi:HNH endonuclease [Aerococcaceae bacterium NML191219]|nr:HNH endonuclease [Aerococcaceae bacterium NML191219]
MPRKPKRPCSYPSCPRLCEGRFCTEHEKLENKNYEKYKRNPDVRKRYGSVWRKIRESYVKVHPFCEICFKEGRMKQVEEVHHIKPLSEGGTHHKDNLISLCQSCHARIHAKNGSRWNKNRT